MGFWSSVRERMRTRNPWLSGALNFFAWGLGYLYAGRKKVVGVGLLLFIAGNYTGTALYMTGLVPVAAVYGIFMIAWLVPSIALARDAYIEAKARNEEESDDYSGN